MTIKKRVRILSEHGSDGKHNSVAQDTLNITVEHNSDGTHLSSMLTEYFASTEQTITVAGPLQIAHGLSAEPEPDTFRAWIVCKTAEHNYSIGDRVPVAVGATDGATTLGMSMIADSTNINIRFSAYANVFVVLDFATGGIAGITPANWKLVVSVRV
jgi:hypothetical protein